MNTASEVEYAAFVGIDWADRKHDVCLQAAAGSKREFSVLAHRSESIAQVGTDATRTLRRSPCHRVHRAQQRTADLRPAAVRLRGDLSGQPDHAGEVPRGVLSEPRQGRPHRRRARTRSADHAP